MFFVWVLDVSLVTGLTRYVATFQSPRQEDTGVGPWGGWGQEGCTLSSRLYLLWMQLCGHSRGTSPFAITRGPVHPPPGPDIS